MDEIKDIMDDIWEEISNYIQNKDQAIVAELIIDILDGYGVDCSDLIISDVAIK